MNDVVFKSLTDRGKEMRELKNRAYFAGGITVIFAFFNKDTKESLDNLCFWNIGVGELVITLFCLSLFIALKRHSHALIALGEKIQCETKFIHPDFQAAAHERLIKFSKFSFSIREYHISVLVLYFILSVIWLSIVDLYDKFRGTAPVNCF